MYKFEKLDVWKLSLEYLDLIYMLLEELPKDEVYNLKSQFRRAATSVALNIAEGSTGQTDAEQARFLGHATRSLIESVACLRIGERLGYFKDESLVRNIDRKGELLAKKLQAMRNSIAPEKPWLREERARYTVSE